MSKCRSCGAPIRWAMNPNGRWIPYNLNGVLHFETCPHAKQWKGKKKIEQTDHVGHLETLDSKQMRLK